MSCFACVVSCSVVTNLAVRAIRLCFNKGCDTLLTREIWRVFYVQSCCDNEPKIAAVLSVEELDDGFSPEGEVTVAVRYAGLIIKDGLSEWQGRADSPVSADSGC